MVNPSKVNLSKVNPSKENPSKVNPSKVSLSKVNPSYVNPSKVSLSKDEDKGGEKLAEEELKKNAEDSSKTVAKLDKDKKNKRKSEVKRNSAGNKSQLLMKKQEKSSEPKPDLLKASDNVEISTSNASNLSEKSKAKPSKSKLNPEDIERADRVVSDTAYVPEMQYSIKLTPSADLVVEENIFKTDFGDKHFEVDNRKLPADNSVAKKSSKGTALSPTKKESKSSETPTVNTTKRTSKHEQKSEVSTKKEAENITKSKTAAGDKSIKVNQEMTDKVNNVEPEVHEKHDDLKKSEKSILFLTIFSSCFMRLGKYNFLNFG